VRFALNTLMWAWDPFEEVLDHAAALGVEALDLGALPGCGHLRLPVPEGFAESAIGRLAGTGRVVAVTADHPGLGASDGEAQEAGVAYTLEALRVAGQLGAPVVGTSLGSVGEGRSWPDAAVRATESLRELFRRHSGEVRLALEVHVNDVCNSLEKASHFIAAVNDPRLGVAFDTSLLFHNHIGLDEAFGRLSERLYHVHLRGATRETYFAVPGRDEVDFPGFFRRLRDAGYSAALSLELYEVRERYGISTAEALREAIPYLLGLQAP